MKSIAHNKNWHKGSTHSFVKVGVKQAHVIKGNLRKTRLILKMFISIINNHLPKWKQIGIGTYNVQSKQK